MDTDKQKRRKKAEFAAPVDRLPPHSIEAEQGVLGCIMLDPLRSIEECDEVFRGPDVFYDLRHQEIYEAARHLIHNEHGFDLITLQAYLKKRKRLEQVGGISYLASLPDMATSAANLPHYTEIVCEKYEMRRIVETCHETVAKVYEFTGPLTELKAEVQADLREVFAVKKDFATNVTTWNDLIEFDTDNDENCVIGMRNGKTTRWLCRGHGAWLIGPSGVGKSSLMMAFGASFALGLPRWGVTPVKPLRVGIIQAENDEGDMSEMAKGVEFELGLGAFSDEAKAELIHKNLITISTTGRVGQQFCLWLRDQIMELKLDLVLADPLLSFAGIDVSRQDQASQFCRVWLDPVLRETGAVLLSVHHTGKPPRNDYGKPKSEPTLYDMAYSGIGSSELVNWARAIMLLQPAGNGVFRLMMAKRGKRAWATHPNGEPTQTLWLKHGATGIYWEQVEPPEEKEAKPEERKLTKPEQIATMNLSSFVSACPNDGEGLREIVRRLAKWLGSKDSTKKSLASSESSIRKAIELMLDNEKLKLENKLYFKGPQS